MLTKYGDEPAMKIRCTLEQKEWLQDLMVNSDRCPIPECMKYETCAECVENNIAWEIVSEDFNA